MLKIKNWKLKIENYKLQIFNFKSQIVNCQYLIQISNLLSQTLNANREETVRFIPVERIEIYCFDDCHGDSTKMGLYLNLNMTLCQLQSANCQLEIASFLVHISYHLSQQPNVNRKQTVRFTPVGLNRI